MYDKNGPDFAAAIDGDVDINVIPGSHFLSLQKILFQMLLLIHDAIPYFQSDPKDLARQILTSDSKSRRSKA